MDAIATFARHVVETRYEDLPEAAIEAARTYLIDTLGVGMAGSAGPWVEELIACQQGWGSAGDARAWVRGTRLPAPAAAMVNAYQIHNSEFDCVHERAVVHPMAVLTGAMMAEVDRAGGIAGRDLLAAIVLGVDVACHMGVAVKSGLRFFRPATAGGFAATAAVGRLRGFDVATLTNAFGITYAQTCGTMQAHTEGLSLLGMQIGFNARNAIAACDMAERGLVGTADTLEGPYGYFRLIEAEYDIGPVLAEVGRTWRITEVAHKPFPSGRATHGVVDGALTLKRRHGFQAADIAAIRAAVPPLTHRLVGRPIRDDMEPNYARLCVPFVTARALLNDRVGVEDFAETARRDPASLALGRRIEVTIDGNPDPNALTPVTVEVELADGRRFVETLDVIYGNPARPMTREAHLDKVRRNAAAAVRPLKPEQVEALIATVDRLEDLADCRRLVDLICCE